MAEQMAQAPTSGRIEGAPCCATERTVTMKRVSVTATVILFPYILYLLRYGLMPSIGPALVLAFAIIASIPVHEGLHALGFVLYGHAPWEELSFGCNRRMPYAHCRAVMPVRAYRCALLLPAIALGVIPGIVGLLMGAGPAVTFGVVSLAMASTDINIAWVMRSDPAEALARDHPTKLGCIVYGGKR